MKNILFTLMLAIAGILFTNFAQGQDMFKYQAVLRDATGQIIANQQKPIKVEIFKKSLPTTAEFTETHTVNINAQGIINLNIGSVNQTLNTIDWSADDYFIQITVDGTVMGTSPILTVPYALNAKTANTANSIEYANVSNKPVNATTTDDGFMSKEDKAKLDGLSSTGGEANVQVDWTEGSNTNDAFIKNKPTLSIVATSGSYDDLSNKPVNATTTDDGFMSKEDKTKLNIFNSVTATAGRILVADGTDFESVVVGEDATMAADGALTILDNSIDGTDIALGSDAGGDIMYYDGTANNWVRLPKGTDGQVLTLETGAPKWKTASGGGATHYVGELMGPGGVDGVVFYVDQTGEHGLICSIADVDGGSGVVWSSVTATTVPGGAVSEFNGSANTTAINAQSTTSAASLCLAYTTAGTTAGTWYLPSIDELSKIYHAKYEINKALNVNSFAAISYWSSTEHNVTKVWYYGFGYGHSNANTKGSTYRVRAVRAF